MRTIKRVYDGLIDKEWVISVIHKAARGKKKRNEVMSVLTNIDECAECILLMLKSGDFELRPVRHKTIVEKGKERQLTISPFYPNRILDYIIVETLKPYIRRSMYHYCVGNVDKRGIHFGEKSVERHYKKYKYYLKLDIRKYYPSVTSENLISFIGRKVKDERFMRLVRAVVGQCSDLPIGSYYSQWLSNWYLEDLDHYIKEVLNIPFYIRYVDDMLLMGNNKRKLLNAMYNISRLLGEKGLVLKRFEQVKRWESSPIDFLGFRFGKEIMARKSMFLRIMKLIRKVRRTEHIVISQARSLLAYIGWMKYFTRGFEFYNNRVKPFAPKGALRRLISNYDRRAILCLH